MPSRRQSPRPPAPARRRGLTLIEVMITTVLVVAVIGTLASLLVSQARMVGKTQGAAYAQRDVRMGLSLLPMDLRGAARSDSNPVTGAIGSDFVTLDSTRIELFATIGNAIVCDTVLGRKAFYVPPTNTARATLTRWYTPPLSGDTLKILVRSATGAIGDAWLTAAMTADTSVAPATACSGALLNPYVDAALDAGKSRIQFSVDTLRRWVRPGAPVRILRRVRYELYDGGAGRWYLGYREYVRNAWSAIEPIAGPFEAAGSSVGAGVRFTYFDTLGTALAPPISATRLGRIDLRLRARQFVRGGGADSVVVRDSVAVRVALRNRT